MTVKLALTAFLAVAVAAVPASAAPPSGDKDKPDESKAKADPFDPFEDPLEPHRFIGLRYRDAILPKFMLNWFAEGGRNVNVPMVGPEFTTRRRHLELIVSALYADYTTSAFLFKGKQEPETGYELVGSSLRQIYLMLDILYEIPLEKDKAGRAGRFALLVGGGVGIGFVFGSLYRSQAAPKDSKNPNFDDASGWVPCSGFMKPDTLTPRGAAYCDPLNDHYSTNVTDGYAEPSWANGGSKPNILPWVAIPQVSFRYKPLKQLQTRADLGFSTSGFFFGLAASYGL